MPEFYGLACWRLYGNRSSASEIKIIPGVHTSDQGRTYFPARFCRSKLVAESKAQFTSYPFRTCEDERVSSARFQRN